MGIKKLMGYEEGWRSEFPESLVGVPIIRAIREDGTTVGIRAVDGYYQLEKGVKVRQIREYDVNTDEEAVRRAKTDGLVQGIMVEQYMSELEPCVL